MKKYLDFTGLQTLVNLLKERFVQKSGTKQLSDENYSAEEKSKLERLKDTEATTGAAGYMSATDKAKLDGVSSGAEVNVIAEIKRNGSILQPEGKSVDVKVPVKTSELTNDSSFQTLEEVRQLISQASTMKKQVVSELPQSGEENVIYLKGPKADPAGNIYDEYLWIDNKWEQIGSTATTVDLSGYLKKTDITEITNQEIEQMVRN